MLNISGESTYGKMLVEYGPLFTIRHACPAEIITSDFLGIGTLRTKMIIEELEREKCSFAFTQLCLEAFLNNNTAYLTGELG